MAVNWTKLQKVVAKVFDLTLTFGAGALLDPSVSHFVGTHEGVSTGIAIALAVLRAADKALGGKAVFQAAENPKTTA